MKTMKELANDAIQVQDACNLSGVAYAFAKAVGNLRELLPDADTKTINQHPIVVLWIDKLADLARCCDRESMAFSRAYDQVRGLLDEAQP